MEFLTFQDAWLGCLRELRAAGRRVSGVIDPHSVGSAFGAGPRDFVELIAAQLRITDPRARLICAASYQPDVAYSIAQTLWTLFASDDARFIQFYNPRGSDFATGGRLLSAPGPRIFGIGLGDQFAAALALLARDPSSRRAMLQFFLPEDMVRRHRDTSCIGSLHFFVRDDHLHSIVTMRSQSAVRVLPHDSFLLSMLHEAAALELGIPVGDYILFCGSLHYYAEEEDIVSGLIRGPQGTIAPMPPMESKLSTIRPALQHAEAEIRRRLEIDATAPVDFQEFDLDRYWTDLLRVLVSGVRIRRGAASETEIAELPSPYRTMIPRKGAVRAYPSPTI